MIWLKEINRYKNEWMNEWTNEQTNEWTQLMGFKIKDSPLDFLLLKHRNWTFLQSFSSFLASCANHRHDKRCEMSKEGKTEINDMSQDLI